MSELYEIENRCLLYSIRHSYDPQYEEGPRLHQRACEAVEEHLKSRGIPFTKQHRSDRMVDHIYDDSLSEIADALGGLVAVPDIQRFLTFEETLYIRGPSENDD